MSTDKELSENIFSKFLTDMLLIQKKYETINKTSPNKFNIFSILDMETKEVKTHSAFLAELLNPNGSHNLGDSFLKLFLKPLNVGEFDTSKTRVDVERYAGKISADKESGGFIDIYLQDGKNAIIIENKIYAGDQFNQLVRYNNFNKNAKILYLTLYGKVANKDSAGDDLNYERISYQTDIISWLEKCVQIAVNYPFVRETINQYIILIKKLTNQSVNVEEKMDITNKILDNYNNVLAFLYMDDARADVYKALDAKLVEKSKKVIKDLGCEFSTGDIAIYDQYGGFSFSYKGINVRFQFEQRYKQDLTVGILADFDKACENADSIREAFRNNFHIKEAPLNNQWWVAYEKWHDYRWWSNEMYKKVMCGDYESDLGTKVKAYIDVIDKISGE